MGEPMVQVADVEKQYRRGKHTVTVLHDFNLTIDAGEFVSIMGPSGSGKSTLLNLIGGLDRPSSGRVTVAGAEVHRLGSAALARWRSRHVGFVFQFYNLIAALSARRNVEIPLLLAAVPAKQRRRQVEAALRLVGLEERIQHKPSELSGGEQQRVAIARAIVADPTLIICDEPTGDLDRATADEVLDLLGRLNRDLGKTIIMVTHDSEAAGHASRCISLDKVRRH